MSSIDSKGLKENRKHVIVLYLVLDVFLLGQSVVKYSADNGSQLRWNFEQLPAAFRVEFHLKVFSNFEPNIFIDESGAQRKQHRQQCCRHR